MHVGNAKYGVIWAKTKRNVGKRALRWPFVHVALGAVCRWEEDRHG
jgi:hypothetical protein